MPRVLLAPDKFKGTLTAAEVADHLAPASGSVRPDVEIVVVPVADGGDGLLDALRSGRVRAGAGAGHRPDGRASATRRTRVGATEAVVEMAEVCGLARLPGGELAPATATSRGIGEVIAAALDAGCTEILLGDRRQRLHRRRRRHAAGARGPRPRREPATSSTTAARRSATCAALDLLRPAPAAWRGASIRVACDVDNPLTGPDGAAAVYGPQKGAGPGPGRRASTAP